MTICTVGTWYFLKMDPGEEVKTLRVKVNKLTSSNKAADWKAVTTSRERRGKNLYDRGYRHELARRACDRILEILPDSAHDLQLRGQVEESVGNLPEALKWYNRVSSLRKPPPSIELKRALVLRRPWILFGGKRCTNQHNRCVILLR